MKVVVDNALAPVVAESLREAGYDALHVRDLGLASSTDAEILQEAKRQDRVVVSRDTDFSALLATTHWRGPSVMIVRTRRFVRPRDLGRLIARAVALTSEELQAGSVVIVRDDRLRVRRLPLFEGPE